MSPLYLFWGSSSIVNRECAGACRWHPLSNPRHPFFENMRAPAKTSALPLPSPASLEDWRMLCLLRVRFVLPSVSSICLRRCVIFPCCLLALKGMHHYTSFFLLPLLGPEPNGEGVSLCSCIFEILVPGPRILPPTCPVNSRTLQLHFLGPARCVSCFFRGAGPLPLWHAASRHLSVWKALRLSIFRQAGSHLQASSLHLLK